MAASQFSYPYDTIVLVNVTFAGVTYQGSGVLISPDEVLTASHLLYSSDFGTASGVTVVGVQNAFTSAPTTVVRAATLFHFNPIVDSGDRISNYDSQSDFALIHLNQPIAGAGSMGIQANFAGGTATISGYPASAAGALVSTTGSFTDDPFYALLDGPPLGPGSSGGPLWITDGYGNPEIVGVVSSELSNGSLGYNVLLTSADVAQISAWLTLDESSPPVPGQELLTVSEFQSSLDQVQADVAAGRITTVTLVANAEPDITVTLAQLTADIAALRAVTGVFIVDVGSNGMRGGGETAQTLQLGATSHIASMQLADGQLVFDPNDAAAEALRLYRAALGRAPDVAGESYYVTAIDAGASLPAIASGFVASPEFQSMYGNNLPDAQFITLLYENVLARAPDAAGLAYYEGELNAGTPRANILVGFSESPENRADTAAATNAGIFVIDPSAPPVARLYDTVFGRPPDTAGLRYWDDLLDSGQMSLTDIVNGFMMSPEFVATYGGLSTSGFVTALYTNTLHRAPDPAGLGYYVNQLNTGAITRAGVVLDFSESPEHQANTAANIYGPDNAHPGVMLA